MSEPIELPELAAGDEIVLRPWREADVAALTEACNDESLSRWLPRMPYPYGEDDARAFLTRNAEGLATGRGGGMAITESTTGRILGGIGLRYEEPDRIEVGYWVRSDARGRGIAVRALLALARWAFGEGDVMRIQLHADVRNTASQRVAEKAGFTREGIARSYVEVAGERTDQVQYSLLPDDL